jgi:hypothetical protein
MNEYWMHVEMSMMNFNTEIGRHHPSLVNQFLFIHVDLHASIYKSVLICSKCS